MAREPLSEAHKALGELMRAIRETAGVSTHEVVNSARGRHYGSGSISNVENGYQKPGEGMLEDYARQFGRRIELRLASARVLEEQRARNLARSGHGLANPMPPTVDSPLDEIYASYRVEEDHKAFLVDSRGVLTELNIIQKIRAVQEGAHLLSASYSYEIDLRPGVLSVKVSNGATIASYKEDENGSINLLVELNKPMSLSDPEPAVVSYKVIASTDMPTKPLLCGLALAPIARTVISVQFTEPSMPSKCWWFRTRMFTGPEQKPPPDRIMPISPTGFYFYEFRDVTIGEFHGLAWSSETSLS